MEMEISYIENYFQTWYSLFIVYRIRSMGRNI